MTLIGTVVMLAAILGLFYLVREKGGHTSSALWIPVLWLIVVGSRPVSMWLNLNRNVTLETQYTEGSPVDAAYYGLLILAGAFVLNRRWRETRQFLQSNLPILLFLFYCAVSITWTDDPAIALKRWIKAVGEFVIILVVLTDPTPSLAMKRLFNRVGFVLIPLSVLFIYVYPSMGAFFDPSDNKTIYFGVCTWKNQLGVLCMVCGLGSLWQCIEAYGSRALENRNRPLIAHGAIVIVAAWLMVKCDAMTSFSCYALAGAVMVLTSTGWVKRRSSAVFTIVASATGLALFALFIDSAGTMLQSIGRNSTLTGRTQIWAAVLAQHINPILGTGFESFWMGARMQSVWDLSQVGIEEAHNGYLEFYLNLGWVGIAVLGLLIVSGYRNAASLFRRDPNAGRLRIALFTASLIFNCTEAGFRMMTPIWIAFLLATTAVPQESFAGATARETLPVFGAIPRRQPRILQ